MKKILSIAAVVGLVLAFGTAYAGAGQDKFFLNSLDPSKVPGYVELETGSVTLAPAALIAPQGSAAGGISVEHDTLLNYLDPSKIAGYVDPETGVVSTGPKAFTQRGSAAGGMRTAPDTTAPGYIFIN